MVFLFLTIARRLLPLAMSAKTQLAFVCEVCKRICKQALRSRYLLPVTWNVSSGEAPKTQAAWKGTGIFGSEVFFTLEFTQFLFPSDWCEKVETRISSEASCEVTLFSQTLGREGYVDFTLLKLCSHPQPVYSLGFWQGAHLMEENLFSW